ncbi:hypothetical protein KC19_12G023200 [Ceratodon purpureus]|uniref:Myb-like domain-containing protein n=1 Tax=Ceratodon purpureus TaxID=3225 RepID=A0A8T0G6T2_CERPU|nr:hypothetical protein KC19_12G023200 [Ceratodon purpureus]
MAREWSLPETKALVEEHIALKEEEKAEVRTASEHWNKVAKKLRERGFNRSHKSCNKRWYRLEQYEVQIFSFNMEEGKHKNFWDLTKAERLEYRDKWPQLPSGDGIDKEIFDALKRFSHQYEKKEKISEAMDHAGAADKEVVLVGPKTELTRPPPPPPPPPPVLVATPRSTSAPLSHPMVAGAEVKRQEEPLDSQAKNMWPAPSEVQQPLPSQDALDGFKLQARELRRRRAAELRRNNRTVPYNSTHTTFMKATPPSQLNAQNSPRVSEATPFGSVTNHQNVQSAVNSTTATKENVTPSKPSFQLKRPNPFTNQAPPNNHRYVPAQPQPTGGNQVNFQSQNLNSTNAKTSQQLGERTFGNHRAGGHLPLLQSINSHLPLLQPEDGHVSQLGSLEEQLQMILGVNPGPLQAAQHCEQQLHKNQNMDGHHGPQFRRNMHQENGNQGSATASLLGAAIGGLGVQLGSIVKLMQAKHTAEQEFRDKMLMFVECMVVSLHTMAQVSARTSG